MHDVSKLLIAKMYGLKIDREVHATAIKVLRELLKDKEILKLIEDGYEECQKQPRTKVRGVFLSTPKIPIIYSMLKS